MLPAAKGPNTEREKGLINPSSVKAHLWLPTVFQEQTSQMLGDLVLFTISDAFILFYTFLTLMTFTMNNKHKKSGSNLCLAGHDNTLPPPKELCHQESESESISNKNTLKTT